MDSPNTFEMDADDFLIARDAIALPDVRSFRATVHTRDHEGRPMEMGDSGIQHLDSLQLDTDTHTYAQIPCTGGTLQFCTDFPENSSNIMAADGYSHLLGIRWLSDESVVSRIMRMR